GKSVMVIGGGNVAIDVARSAHRLGSKVTICYRREEDDMPAYREEIEAAKEEGIEFVFLVAPERVIQKDGKAMGVAFKKMRMGEYTDSGRRRPEPTEEEIEIKADTIVTAIGQKLDKTFAGKTVDLLNKKNLICANMDTLATPVEKVFAGGDAVTGPSSVIEAIAQGKQAARSIDIMLSGEDRIIKLWSTRKFDYSMEEPTDNDMKMNREKPKELLAKDRECGFNEVVQCLDKKCAEREAKRCLRCDLSSEEVE
ncbi:MAG: FAD-dependent oxidoreductase, partial [Candidatus Thermoplasmatota archaeon]|nr:FAD-dependent oxidoreductase [Candidatus Thermoplasmatota archaeon]